MENFSLGGQGGSGSTWATPQMPFGTPVMAGGHTWSTAPGELSPSCWLIYYS